MVAAGGAGNTVAMFNDRRGPQRLREEEANAQREYTFRADEALGHAPALLCSEDVLANDAVSGPEAVEPEQTRRRSGRGQVVLLRPLEVALGAEAVGTERLLVPRAFVNVLLQGRVRARQPGDGVDTLDADDGCDVLRHI